MSRVGRQPVHIPDGVTVTVTNDAVTVHGPKGELSQQLHPTVNVEQQDAMLVVTQRSTDRQARAFQGLTVRILTNLIQGVTEGFNKQLEINGVGYKAATQGNTLTLHVGYSHPVELTAPEGIDVSVAKNMITISGIDKQQVGQFAAEVRAVRPPEPYKGKGIKYSDEHVRRKAGKAAKAAGAAA